MAALYSRQLLPAVADHLQKGEYRLRRLYQAVPAAYVDESFRPALYLNINTPEAYEAAKGRDANSCRQVPVVTLTAPDSGDGKTTAATAAIAELTRRVPGRLYQEHPPYRHPPKDWVRHGPGPKSRRRLGLSLRPGRCPEGLSKEDYILALSQQQLADLVLVESRSHGPFPRIDVTQADTGTLVDDILFLTGYRSSAI